MGNDGDDDKSAFVSGLNEDAVPDFEMHQRALLMPHVDRDLHAIFLGERPEIGQILRDCMKQIVEALQHSHGDNVIHGDMKLLNVVRLRGQMVLIDLDASVKVNTHAGCKFSSGALPPEMICSIDNEDDFNKFKNHFQNSEGDDDNRSRWDKIEPKIVQGVATCVVKTFDTATAAEETFLGENAVEKAADSDQSPHDLAEATHAFDAWSLGTIFHTLLKGKPLFPVNRDDDLEDARAMKELCDWNDKMMEKKMNEGAPIPAQAKDLLQHLLQRDPLKQLTVEAAPAHDFFHHVDAGLDEKLNKIDTHMSEGFEKVLLGQQIIVNMSQHMQDELSRTRSILLHGVFEATEVQTPTVFVITKDKLSIELSGGEADHDDNKIRIKNALDENGEGFQPDNLLTEDQKSTVKKHKEEMEEAKLWTSRVKTICTGVVNGDPNQAFDTVKDGLGDLAHS